MAITKTHPIKTTLNLAMAYIQSSHKTNGKILISSFGCSPETADIEFELTRKKTFNDRGTHIARHLIQSFSPGEVTAEKAHEIGTCLADKILCGKYEYVISTHIDKGHIHNHIIFNTVSFIDGKKYHSNRGTYRRIRSINDDLCSVYGLSVVAPRRNNTVGVKLIIDIENCIKAQESKGYEYWAKIYNAKETAKTMNFLTENNIKSYEELERKYKELNSCFGEISVLLRDTENQIKYIAELIKNVDSYTKCKPIYEQYKKAKNKSAFYEKNRQEIMIYERVYRELKTAIFPDIKLLRSSYSKLSKDKIGLYEEYKKEKQKMDELYSIKSNVDKILSYSEKDIHTKTKDRSI